MIRSFGLAMLGAATGLITPSAAHACYIPELQRLAGETDETYRAREISLSKRDWLAAQAQFRDSAFAIFLVRVTRLEPTRSRSYGLTTQARVTQILLLKGPELGRNFAIRPDGTMWCGSGADDLARSNPGATFVLFMKPGRPGNKTLIKAIESEAISDPILRALLDKR